MNYFSSEKLSESKIREDAFASAALNPKLAYQMMDSARALTVRMVKCGERKWTQECA